MTANGELSSLPMPGILAHGLPQMLNIGIAHGQPMQVPQLSFHGMYR